jgi:hypothetical protein
MANLFVRARRTIMSARIDSWWDTYTKSLDFDVKHVSSESPSHHIETDYTKFDVDHDDDDDDARTMSYSDLDAAAFYQAAFTDDNDNNDTNESPRLPLLKKSPRTRGLDLKMSQQPLMIQVRPLDLKRKGASGGGYQTISMKPSEFVRKDIV